LNIHTALKTNSQGCGLGLDLGLDGLDVFPGLDLGLDGFAFEAEADGCGQNG